MTPLRRGVAALALALLGASSAGAQRSPSAGAPSADRARLERQFRERVGRTVQARLQLTDAQMARLQRMNSSFETRRRSLAAEERSLRFSIGQQIAAGDRADQDSVARMIDRAIGIQRQRLDLVAQEQRELSSFLTPVQRARYLDLQERLRRRVEELRRQQRRGQAGQVDSSRAR